MGRKPADYNEQAFQGLHARFILIVIDEACGVPESLWTAVLTLMTNVNARVLAIGNPDDPGSHFAQICKPGSGWNVITIPAFDTPNFTGEPISDLMAENLVTPMWVEDRRRDWGEGSPLWQAKVMAEFPDVSDEYLISPAMIQKAIDTELPGLARGRYGLDVSRFGQDQTVMYRNRGGVIRLTDHWGMTDTMRTTGKAKMILDTHHVLQKPEIVIDVIGLGAGVFDRLREQGYPAIAFNGAERAYRPDKFKNRRAELYWTFRAMLENGMIDLDEEDKELQAQLQNIKWWVDSTGRIQIESKEDMKERGVKSPDYADAAVYSTVANAQAIYQPIAQGSLASDLLTMEM